MKSGMLPWLAIILSVGMLILFLLPLVLDVNRFRSRYLPVLERVLQRPVAVQNVRLTFFPRLGIRLQGLTIADDPAINSAPFLTIPSAEIVFQWKSLLHRSLQVENVRLQNPVVHLIRTTDGSLNTATIGQAPDPQSEKSPGEPHAQPGNFHPFLLGIFGIEQFAVTGGTLKYEDRSREQFHVYRLKNLKMETRFFHMGQTADIRIQGTMLPLGLPFSFQGQLGPLQLTADITRIHAVGTFGNNEVTAHGAVNDGRLELNVHVPRVSSTDFHQGWPLAESLEFQQLQARLIASFDPEEGMPLFSGVAVNPLTFNIHFNKSLLHVSGDGSAERLTLRGTSPAVIIPVRALPDIPQGSVELEQLIVETEVQEGSIQFKSIQARIFRGTLEAQGEWQRKSSVPSLYFKGQFTQFAVEPLLRDLFPSSLELTGTGDLHWNIGEHGLLRRQLF